MFIVRRDVRIRDGTTKIYCPLKEEWVEYGECWDCSDNNGYDEFAVTMFCSWLDMVR